MGSWTVTDRNGKSWTLDAPESLGEGVEQPKPIPDGTGKWLLKTAGMIGATALAPQVALPARGAGLVTRGALALGNLALRAGYSGGGNAVGEALSRLLPGQEHSPPSLGEIGENIQEGATGEVLGGMVAIPLRGIGSGSGLVARFLQRKYLGLNPQDFAKESAESAVEGLKSTLFTRLKGVFGGPSGPVAATRTLGVLKKAADAGLEQDLLAAGTPELRRAVRSVKQNIPGGKLTQYGQPGSLGQTPSWSVSYKTNPATGTFNPTVSTQVPAGFQPFYVVDEVGTGQLVALDPKTGVWYDGTKSAIGKSTASGSQATSAETMAKILAKQRENRTAIGLIPAVPDAQGRYLKLSRELFDVVRDDASRFSAMNDLLSNTMTFPKFMQSTDEVQALAKELRDAVRADLGAHSKRAERTINMALWASRMKHQWPQAVGKGLGATGKGVTKAIMASPQE